MIVHLNENEFQDKENETCLIDFYADWCPPCQMLAPVLEKAADNYNDEINFYKINIDENINMAEKYEITHVPTLVILKDGKIAGKTAGFMDESALFDFIEKAIGLIGE